MITYRSTDKLEKGDHVYTPDFYRFSDRGIHYPPSPFAVWRVNHVTRKYVTLILLGSKDWVDIPATTRSLHSSIKLRREGPEKHGDGKFVRYIGKKPPWAS